MDLGFSTKGYVYYKDQVIKKVENYETARRTGARLKIEELVTILQGDDDDKFEQVFDDNAHLVPVFLEAAADRKRNGIVEKPRSRSNKKKRRREETLSEDENEEDEPSRKQPVIDNVASGQEQHQPQVAYGNSNVANPHQVARDLHAWRQHDHYWQ